MVRNSLQKLIGDRLRERGWTVIRIWEHEIKPSGFNRKLNLIKSAAQQDAQDGRGKNPPRRLA